MPSPKPIALLVPLLAALVALPAAAADRALLVGVGNYRNAPDLTLDGIDIDIDIMKTVARQLGFAPADTRILHDADATLSAVNAGLKDWLRTGVGPDDRVLIYFSTHGTQVQDLNGDEGGKTGDGQDEALLLHDITATPGPDGQISLTNVLLDDDLGSALAAIPSQNVLVILDVCHSGTATRGLQFRSLQSGSDVGQVKFYAYKGMPTARPRGMGGIVDDAGMNYVSLSAAGDDEKSIATPRGSIFTRGLASTVAAAVSTPTALTVTGVRDGTARFIASELGEADKARVFHPKLGGNPALADKPLRLVNTTAGHGPLWDRVQALAGTMKPLAIQANRPSLREGEKLELTVEVPRDGYLNIVGIDPHDTAIVAFPNGVHPANRNNKVRAGRVRIPGDLPFDLPASPPYGPTLMAAFFTDEPVNLFESGDGPRDANGNMLKALPQPSEFGARGFIPTAKAAPVGAAGTVEVTICPAAGCP